ncbi:type II and III secretion system protein family protein [Galenea microaerophila]
MKNRARFFKVWLQLLAVCFGGGLSLGAMATVEQKYDIMQTESKILKFDLPIKRALIANPDLAIVKVLNAKELLVSGKQAGRTELIIWYRNHPDVAKHIVINILPDQARFDEINNTLAHLMQQLDPEGTVKYELRSIWVNPESSVRREVDNIGNQIDGDATLSAAQRHDTQVLQKEQNAGSFGGHSQAGNYLVLLSGTVPNKARKKRIQSVISALGLSVVNIIKVTGPQQIRLSVRVAEVVKGNPFRAGIALRDKRDQYGIFPPGNLGTNTNFLLNVAKVAAGTQASIALPYADGFQIGINPFESSLYGVLSLLEGKNLARILAKPELTVQSGETADFLVGGELPIPVSQGNGAVSLSYKEFGIRLRFSPIVTESGEIQMTVAPEVSNIDESAGVQTGAVMVPGFRSRKASTTITLKPGQSFVIGGLLQDNLRSQINKIPFLGDIPILGALFRSTSYEKDQTELAILVTPEFVNPIKKNQKVKLPGEDLERPSDLNGFVWGDTAVKLENGKSVLPKHLIETGLEKLQ